jgi:2'-5' RNA ligase
MRLFAAIDLGPAVEEAVAAAIEQVRATAPDAKWVRPEASHLTLAFIGHRPAEDVARISDALEGASAKHPALQLGLQGAGVFGGSRHPRVLWLRVSGDVEPLASLHTDVEAALTPLGYVLENRAFSPHLTLARSKSPRGDDGLARALERLGDVACAPAAVREVILFKSDLSPKGARYTALHRLALRVV